MFDVALAIWLGAPSGLCIFDETCGRGLAMEHNGDVYSCDHFVEPRHRLGNMQIIPLTDLVGSTRQQRFGCAKRDTLPRACRECPVLFACHGGCPKDRFLQSYVSYNMGGVPLRYQWDVQGDIVTHWTQGSKYTGTFVEDGTILSGGWRPEEGKEDPENAAYDATMVRVDGQ